MRNTQTNNNLTYSKGSYIHYREYILSLTNLSHEPRKHSSSYEGARIKNEGNILLKWQQGPMLSKYQMIKGNNCHTCAENNG